jgi:hypothetical protein
MVSYWASQSGYQTFSWLRKKNNDKVGDLKQGYPHDLHFQHNVFKELNPRRGGCWDTKVKTREGGAKMMSF